MEERYGRNDNEKLIPDRFSGIIMRAMEATGRKAVVLIDEYDKPLLETIGKPELQEQMRNELRAFYSVLKSCDPYIRFAMLTGVTKFGRLSVFSGLNNLNDISFRPDYAALCGITEQEMLSCFAEPIGIMAEEDECTADEMVARLRQMYDGYRFTRAECFVYNPFSLISAFDSRDIEKYWFATGTPKYLVDLLRQNNYSLTELEGAVADTDQLGAFNPDSGDDPLPVMYQSGYLTIRDYDKRTKTLTLGFPNEEVRNGFMKYVYPFYAKTRNRQRFDIRHFQREILDGDAEAFMSRLQALTADISYEILANCENDFQNILYIVFTLASIKTTVERRTSDGRIDMVAETERHVYVMEYKVDGSAAEAMAQIDSRQYALPWAADGRQVVKIGACFSTAERRLTEYLIV